MTTTSRCGRNFRLLRSRSRAPARGSRCGCAHRLVLLILFAVDRAVAARHILDASARALHTRIRRADAARLRRNVLVEQIDELPLLRCPREVNVVREEYAAQLRDRDRACLC